MHNQLCASPDPCYDLYPGLFRKLGNGYTQAPVHLNPNDEICENRIKTTQDESCQLQQSKQENLSSQWDLYPGVLRDIENFGTDKMRQELLKMKENIIQV